jgi:hypothetical protein
MSFDDHDEQPSLQSQKIGLKKVSTQQSIFDSIPKKPSQEEFTQGVQRVQEKASASKRRAADLAVKFYNMMSDKTLPQNKNQFQKDLEIELLKDMVNFASDINTDPNEKEGMGSISLIALMLKNAISQRDRINNLEFLISKLEKNK